ncbi:MAG: MFS transporter, partial [Candidatus Thorarchaeota archaeon]|nr:MFS transporter [Candidatus Thorarchaeota archaeon]
MMEELDTSKDDPTLVFGTASLLNDVSSDLIAPIWPTFLTTQLLLSPFQVLVVDGMALTVTSLSKLGAGYASDKLRKRKPFITAGYVLSMFSRVGFLIAYGFYQILFWKSMDRLGKIRGPPRDAMLATSVAENRRGRAFGVLRAMDSAGAVIGAVLTYYLFVFLNYTGIILLSVIPAIGSVILIAALIRDEPGKNVFKGVSFRGLDRNLKIFLVASVLFVSSGFGYAETQLPLLYILFTVVYTLSAYPFGRASDSVGRKPILVIAFLLLAFTSGWAFFVSDWLTVLPLFVFFGLLNGALDPVQTSLIADLVEEERRSSIIGAFQTAIGISALPAGIIIGFLWEGFGALIAFQYSLALGLMALAIL